MGFAGKLISCLLTESPTLKDGNKEVHVPSTLYLTSVDTKQLKKEYKENTQGMPADWKELLEGCDFSNQSNFINAVLIFYKLKVDITVVKCGDVKLLPRFLEITAKLKAAISKHAKGVIQNVLFEEINNFLGKQKKQKFTSIKSMKEAFKDVDNNKELLADAKAIFERDIYPNNSHKQILYKRTTLADDICSSVGLIFDSAAKTCVQKHVTQLVADVKSALFPKPKKNMVCAFCNDFITIY